MPERGSGGGKVRTVYELTVLRKIGGSDLSDGVTQYDELQRFEAEADYQACVRRAHEEIGTERTVTTFGGVEVTARVTRIMVELRSRKVGEWASSSVVLDSEVLVDESSVSERERLVAKGLLMAPVGERAGVLREALSAVGRTVES